MDCRPTQSRIVGDHYEVKVDGVWTPVPYDKINNVIAPDDGGSDVFVHVHDVEAAGMKILQAGQLVAYEVGPARNGRSKAVNLRLLNP
jgi:cold shock protein